MSRSSFFFVFFILILSNSILSYISFSRSTVSVLKKDCAASAEFRQQNLSPELYRQLTESGLYPSDWCDLLTTTMLNSHFHPQYISPDNTFYLLYKKSCYLQLKNYYEAIWGNLQYFPVASDDISYEDSWMDSRTYGGNRHHEGTDLFGPVSQSGYYPIISITDGIVEQKAGCLLADTELVSVLTLADIFIMRIFPPMRKILLPVIECRPEKFLVSWEIPDMDRRALPKGFRCTFTLASISPPQKDRISA